MSAIELVHATTVAIAGRGVLISGPPGSGKSDLALRLIDRGAALVSDDQTLVRVEAGQALASAPETIRGRLEIREVGILSLRAAQDVPLGLCVALGGGVERLPRPRRRAIAGVDVPEIAIDPRPASAPIKVELALANPGMVVA